MAAVIVAADNVIVEQRPAEWVAYEDCVPRMGVIGMEPTRVTGCVQLADGRTVITH